MSTECRSSTPGPPHSRTPPQKPRAARPARRALSWASANRMADPPAPPIDAGPGCDPLESRGSSGFATAGGPRPLARRPEKSERAAEPPVPSGRRTRAATPTTSRSPEGAQREGSVDARNAAMPRWSRRRPPRPDHGCAAGGRISLLSPVAHPSLPRLVESGPGTGSRVQHKGPALPAPAAKSRIIPDREGTTEHGTRPPSFLAPASTRHREGEQAQWARAGIKIRSGAIHQAANSEEHQCPWLRSLAKPAAPRRRHRGLRYEVAAVCLSLKRGSRTA